MSYQDEAQIVGRKPIVLVEMILDYCSLTFSVGPCTASGAAGTECFNTQGTTQDPANYTGGGANTISYWFSQPVEGLPLGRSFLTGNIVVGPFPAIIGKPQFTPSQLTGGQGLAPWGAVQLQFQDFPHHDRIIDKYVTTRTYTPEDQGTFWGKFVARNPHYVGRQMNVYTGFITDGMTDLSDFQKREYILEKIEGPDAKGTVKVTGKDLLKQTDTDRAKVPTVSTGRLITDRLIGDDSDLVIEGVLSEYDAGLAKIRINDEIMDYFSVVDSGGGTLTFDFIVRPTSGTEEADHDAGDTVQRVHLISSDKVTTILQELLEDFANIDPTKVNASGWDPEGWLEGAVLSAVIIEPTGVKEIIQELSEQFLFDLWWDETAQVIQMKALGPPLPTATLVTLDDSNIIADSLKRSNNPEERLTQVWYYYDQVDPTQGDDISNYHRLYIFANLTAEAANEFGTPKIRTFKSRWFQDDDDALVVGLASRLGQRMEFPPNRFTFRLDASQVGSIAMGDYVNMSTRMLQDDKGANLTTLIQITSIKEIEAGSQLEVKAVSLGFAGRFLFIAPNAQVDYGSASDAEKARYGFVAPSTGNFADGGEPYKVI